MRGLMFNLSVKKVWLEKGVFRKPLRPGPLGLVDKNTDPQSLDYPHGYPKMDYTPDDMVMNSCSHKNSNMLL